MTNLFSIPLFNIPNLLDYEIEGVKMNESVLNIFRQK
jgi:hypothetical protein